MANNTEINTFLHACENGDLKYVKESIEKKHCITTLLDTIIDISDENGNTGLLVASANNQLEVLQFLIKNHHAKINQSNDCGWTSLHHACLYGHNEIIKELLKNGASFTMRNELGATPLHTAVASGHISTLKIFLKTGALEDELKINNGPNILVTAVLHGHTSMVQLLVEKTPLLINLPMLETFWTPLMFAAHLGHLSISRILLNHGADPSAKNILGHNVYDVAQDNIRIILKNVLKGTDNENITSTSVYEVEFDQKFLESCKFGEIDVIKEFLTSHSDLKINNITEPDSGATPLMLASIIGHMEIIKLLISQGADLNAKDFIYGWTALMQATFYGHQEVTKYLLKCGADPTIAAFNGCTALDLATLMDDSNTTVIRMLAEETVNIAPPMMSYLPNSRNSSAMTRSLSTPNLNDNNKENSNKNKKNKSSFKGGLKSWWNKISGRFQNVKNRENTNKFSHSVSINIIPDDDDDDEEENIQEINARCTAGNGNDSIFALGFSAAILDLPSNSLSLVQPPHVDEMIVLDSNILNHVSKIQEVSIDTKKLLNKYHNQSTKRHKNSRSVSESQDDIKSISRKNRSSSSVRQILKKLKLDSYNHLFVEHEIDLEAFKLLSDADLLEMGIQSLKIRQKILRSIKHYH